MSWSITNIASMFSVTYHNCNPSTLSNQPILTCAQSQSCLRPDRNSHPSPPTLRLWKPIKKSLLLPVPLLVSWYLPRTVFASLLPKFHRGSAANRKIDPWPRRIAPGLPKRYHNTTKRFTHLLKSQKSGIPRAGLEPAASRLLSSPCWGNLL